MKVGREQLDSIREHYLFSGLAQADFEALGDHMALRALDKGQVLFHRGDPATHFYFVDSGYIELSLIAPTGVKKVLEVIGHGRTFAEAVAFMRKVKFPVTAEALSDSRVCEISNAAYMELLSKTPDACLRLLSDVCKHLHARVRDIERLTIQNARSRLSAYLLEHVTESDDDKAAVRLELPRHVIASRLSIQPETLSRLLKAMSDEGIITVEDRIVFVNSLARLRPYD